MKKMIAVLMVVTMLCLPLNMAFARGGKGGGGAKRGGSKAKAAAAKRAGKRKTKREVAKQRKCDQREDKDTGMCRR